MHNDQPQRQFRGRKPSLPAETKVINLHDAEPGTVLNGFTYDHDLGEWTEYEIVTAYGIERWQRRDFAVLDDLKQANRDADTDAN